jgi:hypothetical protein
MNLVSPEEETGTQAVPLQESTEGARPRMLKSSQSGSSRLYHRRMARMLRIQFEGATYHVINRRNYRRDIFETLEAKQAFANCMFVWHGGKFRLSRPDTFEGPEALADALGITLAGLVGAPETKPRGTGPAGKLRQVFERASQLPREQQKHVLRVVEDALAGYQARKAG